MSTLQLHGILPAGTPRPAEAPAHLRIETGGLIGLAMPGGTALDTPEAAVEAATRHDALLRAHLPGPVLPVRLGAVFSGEATLSAALEAERADHLARLERLAGLAEYGLTLPAPPAAAAPEPCEGVTGGRAFLAARARARDARRAGDGRARALAEETERLARAHAREVCPHESRQPGVLLSLSLLMTPPAHDRLAAALAGTGGAARLRGPWPAYSFAGAA